MTANDNWKLIQEVILRKQAGMEPAVPFDVPLSAVGVATDMLQELMADFEAHAITVATEGRDKRPTRRSETVKVIHERSILPSKNELHEHIGANPAPRLLDVLRGSDVRPEAFTSQGIASGSTSLAE